MTWQRFEERKLKGNSAFIATLWAYRHRQHGGQPARPTAILSLNAAAREQLMRSKPYLDLFIDRDGKRIGIRLLEHRLDAHTYKISADHSRRNAPRICATRLAKRLGILDALLKRNLVADLKHDPIEDLWWFSIAPLLNGASASSAVKTPVGGRR